VSVSLLCGGIFFANFDTALLYLPFVKFCHVPPAVITKVTLQSGVGSDSYN